MSLYEMPYGNFDFKVLANGQIMLPALVGSNHELQLVPKDEYEALGGFEGCCRVAQTITDTFHLSTVLLPMMHSGGQFETMAFTPDRHTYEKDHPIFDTEIQCRYYNYADALMPRKRILALLNEGKKCSEIMNEMYSNEEKEEGWLER